MEVEILKVALAKAHAKNRACSSPRRAIRAQAAMRSSSEVRSTASETALELVRLGCEKVV
jgi:hypothetical protein